MQPENTLLRVFPDSDKLPTISFGEDNRLITDSGRIIQDFTGGATSHMILGWNHPEINQAIIEQLYKFSHLDFKAWNDPNCKILADILVRDAKHSLDRVYFCGNSGGEACEAAIKMSYQWHQVRGAVDKHWVISRDQSYHGSSSDAMSLGDRPNLEIYRPILPTKRSRIPEHNYTRHRERNETHSDYADRCAQDLEAKILELGPDHVAAFVAETMSGGLVGDVPPVHGYWKKIREICDRYNIHLILDEVYCGNGVSGKAFCCDWDNVTPDFIFMGKTLAAGYAPVSAVMTSTEFEEDVVQGTGRLQHSTTYQAYSLGIAAAIKVQEIVGALNAKEVITDKGNLIQSFLEERLGDHPFFVEVRGRGLRQSFEYQCPQLADFSNELAHRMLEKHNMYISAKWHRTSFTPSLLVSFAELEDMLERYVTEFLDLAGRWPK